MSKYRTVGAGQNVDESLFGETQSNRVKSAKKGDTKSSPRSQIPQSVVISAEELERIKKSSVYKTEAEIAAEREELLKSKHERERQAKDRKERMKQLEIQAVAKAKLSDADVERMAREKAIRDDANSKLDERSDVYKALNSMSARAVAFTLREKQLEEKARREAIEREYDRSLDIAMEIDRIKDLQRREQEAEEKKQKRIRDRTVITEQMEQRRRARDIAAEYREQENLAMRNLMKKYADDDEILNQKRREEIERSKLVILAANDAVIERKKQAKELQKKEVEDVLIYQALKDAELAKREEEERALEHAKKARQALLLAQQERAQNNADKQDEIRARRAAEERERRERVKLQEIRAKKKADIDELLQAREAQAADQKRRLEMDKLRRADEHVDALRHMARMEEREAADKKHKQDLANQHRINLGNQITELQANRQLMKAAVTDTGTAIRQQTVRDEAKFSVIRDNMVADLERKGVNPRFLSEMKAVDIGKILRR